MLRRLVYLLFREMSALVSPEERIIVTATLVNGMKDTNELYRSNSIRVLSQVIDVRMRLVVHLIHFALLSLM
jgi:vesicle coat complex subunit